MNEPRKIVTIKPTYEVSVGGAFICPIIGRTSTEITYEPIVTRVDVIRTQTMTPNTTESKIWASGVIFDHVSQTVGAGIALGAVALPQGLLTDLSGAQTKEAFTFDRTNDLEREFAYGYWGENRDGTMTFYWHPVCKLTIGEDAKNTRNDDSPDPNKTYNIEVIPFGSSGKGSIWRVRYAQNEEKENVIPLTIDEFFVSPIYTEEQVDTLYASRAASSSQEQLSTGVAALKEGTAEMNPDEDDTAFTGLPGLSGLPDLEDD
ncbi:MAG: hypothetical protein FWC13_05350 [Oscillospiraceae bacterium]|nr:hypothetical protein [Oscillospiraceae bacterium]